MAKKNKYEELCNSIIGVIGGKSNVTFFTHCVTRLRFNLKDQGLANIEEIKQMPGVIGAQWSNDQLQIIIGQAVGDVYKMICEAYGFNDASTVDADQKQQKQKFHPGLILDGIIGCLAPLLPIMIGAGMFKIVVLLLEMSGIISTESNTYLILNFVGDAGFYFMPVFIGATAAKKFGANLGLGMLMGAMLLHPNFMNAIAEGTSLDLFGLPVYPASYASSIFPAILTVFVMSYIEKFIAKHSPDALRSILEPLLTIIIMVPLSLCIISPAGAIIGEYFASIMMWLYDTTGFLGIGILTAIIPFVIMSGMHMALNPGAFQMLATIGYDPIVMPVMVLNNLNQGAACLAVAVKTKSKEVRSLALSCAITVIIGGVSEPAMYGINLKYKKPLYSAMIGGFAGGCVAGLMHAHAYAFGGMGILGIPAFIGEGSFAAATAIIAGIVIGTAVTFIAGMFLIKSEEVE